MQFYDALELQKQWAKKGNPPCKHQYVEKEYYRGMGTGDKVCTTCGATNPHAPTSKKKKPKLRKKDRMAANAPEVALAELANEAPKNVTRRGANKILRRAAKKSS